MSPATTMPENSSLIKQLQVKISSFFFFYGNKRKRCNQYAIHISEEHKVLQLYKTTQYSIKERSNVYYDDTHCFWG